LVFVTKFRHKMFGDAHLARTEETMRAVRADFETELVEFNGENNHVHLLVNFPPKAALAKLVNSLKRVSSPRMRQEFPDLRHHYYQANKLWRVRTSQARSAAHHRVPCVSTSSSRTARSKALLGPWRPSQRGPSPPP
jgi:putative transposase